MKTTTRMGSCIAGALALGVLGTATAIGGDLNPPSGLIQPTDAVTINQSSIASFPYVIDAPGAYRLTSDINLAGGGTAIFIGASDVTLDLGGFTLRTDTPGAIGFRSAAPTTSDMIFDNLTIKNGTLEGWAFGFLSSNAPGGFSTNLEHTTARDLTVRACTSAGLVLSDNGRVVDCRFYDNSGFGLLVDNESIIERCDFADNNTGIVVEQYGVVRDCHFRGDAIAIASGGISNGYVVVDGNTFVRCTTQAIDFSSTSGYFIVRNIVEDCGAMPIVAPGSQVPISADTSTAGPYDNIVP